MRERGTLGGMEGRWGRAQALFERSDKISVHKGGPLWLSSTISQPGSCHLWDDVGAFHCGSWKSPVAQSISVVNLKNSYPIA